MPDLTDMQALWLLTADPGTWELRRTLECLGEECATLGLVEPAEAEGVWRLTAAGQDAWRRLSADPPADPHRVPADQDAGPAFLREPIVRTSPVQQRRPVAPVDIWRAAKIVADQHGAAAVAHAAQRAEELGAAGDAAGQQVWREILAAVKELQRAVPGTGDVRH